MNNGRWIGGLLLALLAQGPHLHAGEMQWQGVAAPARVEDPGVSLGRPVAIRDTPAPVPAAPAPLSGGIILAGYQVPQLPAEAPAPLPQTMPEIIAVSAPVLPPAPPAPEPEEEPTPTDFAIDRPLRPRLTRRRPNAPIVQASAEEPSWNADWFTEPPPAPMAGTSEGFAGAAPQFPGRQPRFYASGEYLLWWLQGQQVPVLATTSAPQDFGILGAPTTQVLFGGNAIGTGLFSGGRFTAGYVVGCREAVEITGFFLGQRSTNFSVSSFTNPVIGRPFFEVNNGGQESAQLTALPGVAAGILSIHAPTSLWGLEGNLRCLLCCGCNWRVSALAGFRNINLDERLIITENIQGLPTAPAPFTNQTITVTDAFNTQNHFYGGQGGIAGRWYWGRWSIDGWGKVALGANVQLLDISGSQRFVSPTGVVQNFTGGLLAEPSNIGHFSHTAFSVVPEVGLNVGYQILPCLRGFVGYNFLYWSNVIRPGTSIDRNIDVTQIPNFPLNPQPAPVPGRHPAPNFHEVGFWAQGITFGLEFVY
jgi:hypothetical protein